MKGFLVGLIPAIVLVVSVRSGLVSGGFWLGFVSAVVILLAIFSYAALMLEHDPLDMEFEEKPRRLQ